MKYQKDFLKMMLLAAKESGEQGLNCEECWREVDRFAELMLGGMNAAEVMPLVEKHLAVCPRCTEEFQALLEALRATARPSTFRPPTDT